MVNLDFIGYMDTSDWRNDPDTVIDLPYIRTATRMHEDAGYDSILVGYGPDSPDSLQVAAYAAAHSERIRMLVAHRPGIVFPTLAARMFATLDHLTGGRVNVHLVAGGTSEGDPRREGDFLPKDQRYERAGEYMNILKAAWTADAPFSYDGQYYTFEDYPPRVKPIQQPWMPLYLAGSSPAAQLAAGRYADHYAFYGEPLAGTATVIESVRRIAAETGRTTPPKFTVFMRVILDQTDDAAWNRAQQYLERSGGAVDPDPEGPTVSEGERRIRQAAAVGERHDRAMWTARARAWGATINALVGSADTITSALMDYVRLGVTGFRLQAHRYVEDTAVIGRDVIPPLRAYADQLKE